MTKRGVTRGRVLDFLRSYTAGNGFPPTMREIRDGCELQSHGPVAYHLATLARDGLIKVMPRAARSYVVIDSGSPLAVKEE